MAHSAMCGRAKRPAAADGGHCWDPFFAVFWLAWEALLPARAGIADQLRTGAKAYQDAMADVAGPAYGVFALGTRSATTRG